MSPVAQVWEVTVDQRTCMGAGLCNGYLPDRFTLVNGKSVPVETRIEPDQAVLDAADYCPFKAIEVIDPATGESLSAED